MQELLKWIEDEGYVLYKDGTWYKKGAHRPWRKTVYYTHQKLVELWNNSKRS